MKKNIGIIVAVVIAIITVIGYLIIVGTYPFDESERPESYYNTLIIVKAILFSVNILVDAGIINAYIRNRKDL